LPKKDINNESEEAGVVKKTVGGAGTVKDTVLVIGDA
jgi:hypothetical protein